MEEQSPQATYNGMLRHLQNVWEEIGESDSERDAQLLQLEAKCFAIYKEAVATAQKRRDDLRHFIAQASDELQALHGCLGESEEKVEVQGTLNEIVIDLEPRLEILRERVGARRLEFQTVQTDIQKLATELGEPSHFSRDVEEDLTSQHLHELVNKLRALEDLKAARIQSIMELVEAAQELCSVMGLSLKDTIGHVHESLCDLTDAKGASVTRDTIYKLGQTVDSLRDEKRRRVEKLSNLGATILQLCDLMEIPAEQQSAFSDVTLNIGASENGMFQDGMLSLGKITAVEGEVKRLEAEKIIKLKDLVFKKRAKVEEICVAAHMVPPSDTAPDQLAYIIEEGLVDPADLLSKMEEAVARATEEKVSRKEILEAVERWQKACTEEKWLEEFEQDNNRYAPQRGQHLILQRAESARKELKRLPDVVKATMSKVKIWEETRNQEFLYDGESLINILNEDALNRASREQEKKRHIELTREEKKRAAEEEAKYGAHPRTATKGATPSRRPTTLRPSNTPAPAERRLSMASTLPTPQASPDRRMSMGPAQPQAPHSGARVRPPCSVKREKLRPAAPLNVVALIRESPQGKPDNDGRGIGLLQQQRLPLSPRQTNHAMADNNWEGSGRKGSSLRAGEGENLHPRYLEY